MKKVTPKVNSILDCDFYKFTMGQAVANQYPHVMARYGFINRGGHQFPQDFVVDLQNAYEAMRGLRLRDDEALFMESIPFMKPTFVDLLRGFRFDPDDIHLNQNGADLSQIIEGRWYRRIWDEVPVMSTTSELFLDATGKDEISAKKREQRAREKAKILADLGAYHSEFGTRRRRSYAIQDEVIAIHNEICGKYLVGTSNVHFAMKYGIKVMGTQAHEWTQAHAAMFGFLMANEMSMEAWIKEYDGDLGIALPDTFTTDVFLRSFGPRFSRLFDGIRHDSGEAIAFAEKIIRHYETLGIDPMSKTILFSDGLNILEITRILKALRGKVKIAFGIGTNITNDVGLIPMNIVVKLIALAVRPGDPWRHTVKLSDVAGKETGEASAIKRCKIELGILT